MKLARITSTSLAISLTSLLSSGVARAQEAPHDDAPPASPFGESESPATESADDETRGEEADGEDADGTEDAAPGDAEVGAAPPATDELRLRDVIVRGRDAEVFRTGGSVHVLGEEELRAMSYNDPNAVITRVPGVYVRTEDGYGLRPNIGLRGASSERSRKITLMEDGVLLAPAPYSAPAAYYFPLIARMTGVEVSAGPAAIPYGPFTVGGAIDLQSRRIPSRRQGGVDLSLGSTWLGRAHIHYGDSNRWGGFLVEMMHVRSNGFHELDAPPSVGSDTGFNRTDIVVRGELHGAVDQEWDHRLELLMNLGLEHSNETYLGTTDADFRANPYRRYAATQLDRMEWWRTRAMLRYEIESDDVNVRITAYRHDFTRTWYRVDRFCDQLALRPDGQADTCTASNGFDRILTNPSAFDRQYQRIIGALSSEPGDAPFLMARNHRIFAVQGLQADARAHAVTGDFDHQVRFGARLHFDEITRQHTGDTYQMSREQLVLQNSNLTLQQNHDSAWALAAYVSWAVRYANLTVTPGVRTELIWQNHEDFITGERVASEQYATLPGIGLQYAFTDSFAAFGGAHLGFSPVAPGSTPDVLPELAWNYELGARYGQISDPTHGQLTYFVSDYQNLSTVCTLGSGCDSQLLDRQFNTGRVLVMGVEAEAAHRIVVDEVSIPLSASYTWTWSRFSTAFHSDNPQYGNVQIGDELPYVPHHQLSARAGVQYRALEITLNGLFTDRMRDSAGQGAFVDIESTDAFFLLDAMASLEVLPGVRVYVRGENLTNAQPITTRRAWGARGMKPLLVQGGLQIDFR